ncbi:hypothetical protein FACS1894188_12940 [Clostridia bacterium]|nr:hypothetical protein FACS1894188_12940 [Clostridia bacterium]
MNTAALILALTADTFAAAVAYGAAGIKIPTRSVHIINFTCSIILFISLVAGNLLKAVIPPHAASLLCFAVLFALGMVKLLDGLTKTLIRKYAVCCKEIKFAVFSMQCILRIYANPEEADADVSKTLSSGEAFSLSVALLLVIKRKKILPQKGLFYCAYTQIFQYISALSL